MKYKKFPKFINIFFPKIFVSACYGKILFRVLYKKILNYFTKKTNYVL